MIGQRVATVTLARRLTEGDESLAAGDRDRAARVLEELAANAYQIADQWRTGRSPAAGFEHHDLDHLEGLLARRAAHDEPEPRAAFAEQIVRGLGLDELLDELRCLRERPHGRCPDPQQHRHAAQA